MVLRKTNPTRCLIIQTLERFIRKHSVEHDLKTLEQTVTRLRSSKRSECSTHRLQQIVEPQSLLVVGKILRGAGRYDRAHQIFFFEISAAAEAQLRNSTSNLIRLDHTLDETKLEQLVALNPRIVL